MMMAFVRGVIAAMIDSAWTAKPSSELVCTMTGVAPTSLTCSGMVGQYRRVRDDLVARVEERQRGVEERLLAADGQQHLCRA